METTSMVLGGLSGLVLFGVAYVVYGLLNTKKQVKVHDSLLEAIARENTSEHERLNYKMEACDDVLRLEIIKMIEEMHAKLDRAIEVLQNNMNSLDAGQTTNIERVYRDMDSRLDKMAARLAPKPARGSKKEKMEQINS
jgi:hypothetical protein